MGRADRFGRRSLGALAIAAVAAPALAGTIDLAITCDTTLANGLRKVGAAYTDTTSARIFVFPTGPGLILPQLQRDIQNDIVVTQVPILQQAAAEHIALSSGGPRWRNPLVIARLRGGTTSMRSLAASDPTPASDIDGPAILERIGLTPATVLGAVDTDEVAFLVVTGAASAGLMHMSDARADSRLEVIQVVSADVRQPLLYAASVTRLARRPDPRRFLDFLATPQATAIMSDAGLEMTNT